MKKCIVVANGELDINLNNYLSSEIDVIAADGGWVLAKNQGITPNIIIGDFDSSPLPNINDIKVYKLPTEKNDTDTHFIARYLIENNYTDVLMCAMTGGNRIEHTLGNIQTLKYLSKNRVNATIINKFSCIIAVTNGELKLEPDRYKFFSVLSLGNAEDVTIKNAKYNIENYFLSDDYPIGLSNEFANNIVEISVKSGTIIVICSN